LAYHSSGRQRQPSVDSLSPDRVGHLRSESCSAKCAVRTRAEPELCTICAEDRPVRLDLLSAADSSSTATPPRRPRPAVLACLPFVRLDALYPAESARGMHVCRRRPLHAASVSSGVTSAVSPSHGWLPKVPHPRLPRIPSRPPPLPSTPTLSHLPPSPQFAVLRSTAGVPKQRPNGVVSRNGKRLLMGG